jgi:hypothetical protein
MMKIVVMKIRKSIQIGVWLYNHAFIIMNILTVLCLILSPKAQEMLYNFTVILCIPIIWTTFLIGAYYLYLYASYVYVYLAIALIVYMFIKDISIGLTLYKIILI